MEMLLPIFNTREQLLFGFPLIGLLKFIDSFHQGLHALKFTLVFRTNDFLESPLDHEILPAFLPGKVKYTVHAREARGAFRENGKILAESLLGPLNQNPRGFENTPLFQSEAIVTY